MQSQHGHIYTKYFHFATSAEAMDSATSAEIFMVAERAVGQAANDLRGEFGVKLHEITGNIAGI